MAHNTSRTFSTFIVITTGFLLFTFVAISLKLIHPTHFTLRLEMSSSVPSTAQLFYDVGRGYNEGDSQALPVASANSPESFQQLAYTLPFGTISHLRFDPITVEGTVTLRNVVVTGPQGTVARLNPASLKALNQIKSTTEHNDSVIFATLPGANDPGLLLQLAQPLDGGQPATTYMMLLILNSVLLFLIVYLFASNILLTQLHRLRSGPAGPIHRYLESSKLAGAFRAMIARDIVRAALMLLLILNIDFFPCIWGNKTLLESAQEASSIMASGSWQGSRVPSLRYYKVLDPGAPAWQSEPLLAATGLEYLRDHTLPLWNPYQGYGVPLAANMQAQSFFPLAVGFSFLLNPVTYNWYILTRLFIIGICAYLYMRLFVSFVPALAAGIAAQLGGYFCLYMTMPHISVEMLVPGGLLAAELACRRQTYNRFLAFTALVALSLLGGMPESSLLLLTFIWLYIVFRISTDTDLRRRWRPIGARFVAATSAGFGLCAFLLIPLFEYIRHSFNAHEPSHIGGTMLGLWHEGWGVSVFTYFFPLLFGPPFDAGWSGVRNYVGLIACFLILVAVWTVFCRKKPGDRLLADLTVFFILAIAFIVLKRYGGGPVNAVGGLPLFRLVQFPKYAEPILSISAAVLCSIGLERILKTHISANVLAGLLAAVFLVIPVTLLTADVALTSEVFTNHTPPAFPVISMALPIGLLFCASIAIILCGKQDPTRRTQLTPSRFRLTCALVTLLALEFSLNYIPEMYYGLNSLADKVEDPYAGAPYISWLQSHAPDNYRVFGVDGNLYPDWASAFQLFDIRDLDALYYKKYFPFIREFLVGRGQGVPSDLQNRFTGIGNYDVSFTSVIQRRLLQLSSVRYLITSKSYSLPSLRLAYDHEVKIYQFQNALPRAVLFYHAAIARNEQEVLHRLSDPEFDPSRTVLLDATKLKPDQTALVNEVNQAGPREADAGTILSYKPQQVDIAASVSQPGVLVLNDSDYPGWNVLIDGKPGRWFTANYLFRGVLLSPGKHRVRFVYRPQTFYIGAAVSLATLLCISIVPIMQLRRTKVV